MHHEKFNISKQYLSEKIFIPQPPQQGELWPNLNITVLPDYLAYIKNQLTNDEKKVLSEYKLQTYLLETALKAHPKNNFDICTNEILSHIRTHTQFWVKNVGAEQEQKMHQAAAIYHQDCKAIDSSQITEKYPSREYKIPNWIKIQDDYTYFGSNVTKGAHRFSATLYMHISNYLIRQKVSDVPEQELKRFVLQFTVYMAMKGKHRYRQYFAFNFNQSPQNMTIKIESEIKTFTNYLQQENIDDRSLSSAKDYYLISNSLFIIKSYFIEKHLRLSNNMKQEALQENNQQTQKILDTNSFDLILQDLVNRFVCATELKLILNYLFQSGYRKICELFLVRNQKEERNKQQWIGLYNCSQAQLQQVYESYGEIVNHPENLNKMKYKVEGSEVSWSDQLYLKFLQKYLQFYHLPTNNKKIAMGMGKDIQSNHVKHVKGIYTRNMSVRISNGQIGGGRKGTFESKTEFISKDIQNFNMKWFKKEVKGKSKKIKRRRRRQIFADEQHDSDY